ncbi:sulfurtransferase TusA family protein [Azospirillum sp. TSO22-1]|uniref:sulfurtransferase TusA family protein n=1 Tax=Azospirillum sp. TSO22-1 TaxID=716789 RepID=UPI000D61F6B2|nr:sulfurtransferase TusA family protein [Azospirillum sp. TSO22-1]PWC32129.1 SirA family protein [Azospirillum sp. TSO22-1]
MARHELDAKGLLCPLPVLRARKALKALAPGDVLAVEATDPSAPKDFAAFCETTGHRLLASAEDGGVYRIEVERSA